MIDDYVRILDRVAEYGDEAAAERAVQKLVAHLEGRGRVKMLPQILRALKAIAARREALAPTVEAAHENETHAALAAAAKEGITVERAHVNAALIAGWRARKGGTLVDHSAKAALVDIYQKVTS